VRLWSLGAVLELSTIAISAGIRKNKTTTITNLVLFTVRSVSILRIITDRIYTPCDLHLFLQDERFATVLQPCSEWIPVCGFGRRTPATPYGFASLNLVKKRGYILWHSLFFFGWGLSLKLKLIYCVALTRLVGHNTYNRYP
jgi:hypothetical protein